MKMTKENIENIKSDLHNFIKFIDEYDFLKGTYDFISDSVEINMDNKIFFEIPKELIPEIEKAIEEINNGKYTERVKTLKKIYEENKDYINAFGKKYKKATQAFIDNFSS